jgi:hypothetical protein
LTKDTQQAWGKASFVMSKVTRGVNPTPKSVGYEIIKHSSIPSEVPVLEPLKLNRTLEKIEEAFAEKIVPFPRNRNKCATEIGCIPGVETRGTSGTVVNQFVADVVGPLGGCLPGFSNWRVTDTTPRGVEEVFTRKIDSAPKENHQYYGDMWEVYKGIADFIREDGSRLRYLSDEEIGDTLTRDSSMGEPNFTKYRNIGEYYDSGDWTNDVNDVRASLADDDPELLIFNIIGKSEVKYTSSFVPKGSRFVWFYPAAVRMHEMRVVGHLNHLMKMLPFSVSGLPLYDYGDFMWNLWKPDYLAITEDVFGWDTRVSVGIFRLESAFCQMLTDDETQKREIHQLYRAWAYPMFMFRRPGEKGTDLSINRAQGGKASGIQLTYAMNTVTNAALIYTRICKALQVPTDQMRSWVHHHLDNFNDSSIKMIVSGDDSVVMGQRKEMMAYRDKFSVHNVTGFIRKDIGLNDKSEMIPQFISVSFCSHRFAPVRYYDRLSKTVVVKRMPFRTETEIIAKSMIMKIKRSMQLDAYAVEGWARIQGLNLMVNYHHLSNCRLIGLALLDITRDTISFEGLAQKGGIRDEPWIRPGDLLEIVNGCLFGECSRFPHPNFQVRGIRDLGYAAIYIRCAAFQHDLGIKARALWRDGHLLRVYKRYVLDRDETSQWLRHMLIVERRLERNNVTAMPEDSIGEGNFGWWRKYDKILNPDYM